MRVMKFNRIVVFDLSSVHDLPFYEYLSMVQLKVGLIASSRRGKEAKRAAEIAGILSYTSNILDVVYGFDWTKPTSEWSNRRNYECRPTETYWNDVVAMFPLPSHSGLHSKVVRCLENMTGISPNLTQLFAFNRDLARQMDCLQAFVLCRSFLRTELVLRLDGHRVGVSCILRMLATVLEEMTQIHGENWVDEIEARFPSSPPGSTSLTPDLSIGFRERAIRLFPLLIDLGFARAALAAWAKCFGSVDGPNIRAGLGWLPTNIVLRCDPPNFDLMKVGSQLMRD